MAGSRRGRWFALAGAALVVVAAVAVAAVFGGGSSYTVRIDFADAGQLIAGDLVEVGGIPVGSVDSLALSKDGQAQVTITLTGGRFTPLHQGTKASIGTVGLSGVTNRFVALAPGPQRAPVIATSGVIPARDTTPIVDIDALLDTITPQVRANLRRWIQESAGVLHGNVAGARRTLAYAAAAVERSGSFISQVTADSGAFGGLISTGAKTASALAASQHQLTQGIAATASALTAISSARRQLAQSLTRAPAVLGDGTNFLTKLGPTLSALDPVLRDAEPVAAPLAAVLRALPPITSRAAPLLSRIDALLPNLDSALRRLPELSRVALPALAETVFALHKALPIFTGIRPYGEDILQGILHGYGGGSAENYDANGQFSRIALGLPASTLLSAELGFNLPDLAPGMLLNQTNLCPGSAADLAPGKTKIVADGCEPKEGP